VTQLPFGEIINIFDYLGETASELKSDQSKSSISTCPVGMGTGECSQTSS
jgi:hypothetical protein